MQVQYTDEFIAHLWTRVDKSSDCWLWTGATSKAGYGQVGFDGRVLYVHRITLELAGGPLPPGYRSLHTCDTPACVRNDEIGTYIVNGVALPRFGHLFRGTQADNVTDMRAKGRESSGDTHRSIMRQVAARGDRNGSRTHPERLIGRTMSPWKVRPELIVRGVDHHQARLTEHDVREIRRAFASGEATQVALAIRYGITQTNVSCIVRRKTWTHVT